MPRKNQNCPKYIPIPPSPQKIKFIVCHFSHYSMATFTILYNRVAEVAREHGWHPPKSLDSDENFKLEHTLFCRELRFVAIYALFGDLWAKKVPF